MSSLIEVICGNCGKSLKVPKARAGQTGRCAYCSDSILIPDVEVIPEDVQNSGGSVNKPAGNASSSTEYNLPKANSTASYVQPKYRRQRKSLFFPVFTYSFLFFIIGNASGYYFSEDISRVVEAYTDKPHTSTHENTNKNTINKNENTNTNTNNQTFEIVNTNNTKPESSFDKENFLEIISKVEKNTKEWNDEVNSLNQVISTLFRKYDVNPPNTIFKNLDTTVEKIKNIENICQRAKKSIDEGNISNQKQLQSELTTHLDSNMLETLQKDKQKLQEQLNNLDQFSSPEKSKISIRHMGKWYSKLLKTVSKIEKTYSNLSITTSSSAIKSQAIKVEIHRIKNYSERIGTSVQNLEKIIKGGKDPYIWIEERRKNAKSIPQQKQAEYLEKFLKEKKTFIINIDQNHKPLFFTVKNLINKDEKYLVSKPILSKILQSLQAINRQWEEEYQIIDSAISNFSIQ